MMSHKKHATYVLKEAKQSLVDCWQNKGYFAVSTLADIVFLIVYGFLANIMVFKITQYMTAAAIKFGESSSSATIDQMALSPIRTVISENPVVRSYIVKMFLLIFLFMAIAYITYCVFESFSWKNIFMISKEEYTFSDMLKQFSMLNLIWFVFVLIIQVISFFSRLKADILSGVSTEGLPGPGIVIMTLGYALTYLIFISYGLMTRREKASRTFKESFRIGYERFFYLAPAFILLMLLLNAISLLLVKAFGFSYVAQFIFVVVIAMPIITLMKVYFTRIVSEVSKHGSGGK